MYKKLFFISLTVAVIFAGLFFFTATAPTGSSFATSNNSKDTIFEFQEHTSEMRTISFLVKGKTNQTENNFINEMTEMKSLAHNHTMEFLYLHEDSIKIVKPYMIGFKYETDFIALMQERQVVKSAYDKAKRELEFAKLNAAVEREMIKHIEDSLKRTKH